MVPFNVRESVCRSTMVASLLKAVIKPFRLTFFHSEPVSRTSNAICSLSLNLRSVKQLRRTFNGFCSQKVIGVYVWERERGCEERINCAYVCKSGSCSYFRLLWPTQTTNWQYTKAAALPAITLWCFGQFVLVGGLFQLQLDFHHKLPYIPYSPRTPCNPSTPPDMSVLVVLDAKPQWAGAHSHLRLVIMLLLHHKHVNAHTFLCMCVCVFTLIPCGHCHSACR